MSEFLSFLLFFLISFWCNRYEQEPKIQFVIDAVYAFAYALNNLQKDVCPKDEQMDTVTGLCPAMANFDGASLYKDYILNLAFEGG